MSEAEKMTIAERYKYLRMMQKRYQQASKAERQRLLDEMVAVTQFHRKSLVRLMKKVPQRQPRKEQRGRQYGPAVDDALRVIGESFDYICPERLTPNLVWMAELLAKHGELVVSEELLAQLEQISISTVGRIMKRVSQDEPRLPRKRPERANKVAQEIPMKRIAWDEAEVGHLEVDLVHHCGPVSEGQYVHSLQLIDVTTGWSERVALLGRSYRVTADGFRRILARIPFEIQEIHPDNGSEFINYHLIRFWRQQVKGVSLSRSRPYQKNDNRFVEQKNSTLIRAYVGYERLDTVAQTNLLNQLYDQMWFYYNFFQPVLRLAEKTPIQVAGQLTGFKRQFDTAQTPFDRLCQTPALSSEQQHYFQALRDQTNPRQLRQDIYAMLDLLFALPTALPGQTEDVLQTLAYPELAGVI